MIVSVVGAAPACCNCRGGGMGGGGVIGRVPGGNGKVFQSDDTILCSIASESGHSRVTPKLVEPVASEKP